MFYYKELGVLIRSRLLSEDPSSQISRDEYFWVKELVGSVCYGAWCRDPNFHHAIDFLNDVRISIPGNEECRIDALAYFLNDGDGRTKHCKALVSLSVKFDKGWTIRDLSFSVSVIPETLGPSTTVSNATAVAASHLPRIERSFTYFEEWLDTLKTEVEMRSGNGLADIADLVVTRLCLEGFATDYPIVTACLPAAIVNTINERIVRYDRDSDSPMSSEQELHLSVDLINEVWGQIDQLKCQVE